jgi:transglutaminase-like putative cysteine protease
MDTSLRGDLGDEVVMRVRAPSAAYWRGQTFTQFDGRTWVVDASGSETTEGPSHHIDPTAGDLPYAGDPEFIQTFYLEVDMPNIVFAAGRPMEVLLDAPLWQRSDGALRAGVVLPAGSAYTVLSHQSGATAAGLRADGDVSRYAVPEPYTALPPTFTDRTAALAQRLASGSTSTYDTILAIERWLGDNVQYDLDAPVPADGEDAVDDFLFESRRGFCEQIATSTAMMLRSLGIPARIATGYVPSERDEIAGVWISRARDAHAWVEVWFPSYGWVSFDPTASVPLSGESTSGTIGGRLLSALVSLVTSHIGEIVVVALGAAALTAVIRLIAAWWRRRRRGRWGVLQDRFVAAAVARGGAPTAPNADLAGVFEGHGADDVARALDESAFAPQWRDDDQRYDDALSAIGVLERTH